MHETLPLRFQVQKLQSLERLGKDFENQDKSHHVSDFYFFPIAIASFGL